MPISLTQSPSEASIRVTLTATNTHRLRTLLRTDANGTRAVRLQAGQTLVSGSLVVTDYEPALTGPVVYRAETYAPATPNTIVRHEATATLVGARECISAAVYPATRYYPSLVLGSLTQQRPYSSTVHDVIDRPDPLVTIGAQKTRRGTIEFWCASYTEARAVETVYAAGHVMLWRQAQYAGLDMYHVVDPSGLTTSLDPTQTAVRRWLVSVPYIEVAAPTGPILGALTWTVDALAAAIPTVDAVAATYRTVTALAIGPVT